MLSKTFGIEDSGPPVAVNLLPLVEILRAAAREVESVPVDQDLVFARLCDAFRRLGCDPPGEAMWLSACQGVSRFRAPSDELSAAGRRTVQLHDWIRLHLLVESLREPALLELVRRRCREWPGEKVAVWTFLIFARWADRLTIDLLLKNPFRVEEFARKWVDALGGRIAGESPQKSEEQLQRLDYGKVMENLKKAKEARNAHAERVRRAMQKKMAEEAAARVSRE